jgi:hypothetical protein
MRSNSNSALTLPFTSNLALTMAFILYQASSMRSNSNLALTLPFTSNLALTIAFIPYPALGMILISR